MRSLIIILIIALLIVGVVYLASSSSIKNEPEGNGLQPMQTTRGQDHHTNRQASYLPNDSIEHPEWPEVESNQTVVSHTGYSLVYDETHEQARWVAYELTREETGNDVERSNHFIEDPQISTRSATNADYAKSGYDRGHLAPASDMGWSTTSMEESFYFSNMSPQNPSFNRGIWKKLETQVRNWANEHERVYVVTGPILSEGLPTIGQNEVSVPKYYYKVILDNREPGMHGIGFILPNEPSKLPLSAFAVTIDSVEKVTGLDFFPALPQGSQLLEGENCFECW
ncbi:MAG: DNA/RNA non-specific endonuclease [Flavobacteriales bacterium]